MTIYKKNQGVSGAWVKGKDIVSGTKAKLVSETTPIKSQFKDKDGNDKMQDVSKVRFEGKNETFNIGLNRATIEGLIDAFGEDSKDWINKMLIATTEKVMVGGKRVVALYLVPEGYVLEEDDDGYMQVVSLNKEKKEVKEVKKMPVVEYPEDDINLEDIPF